MNVTPYAEGPNWTLYCGHVMDVLRSFESNSVHMVITSPPYYGTRCYDVPPLIWDGDPYCDHEWEELPERRKRWGLDHNVNEKQASNRGTAYRIPQGSFCMKCEAWRGQLGLEPTPALFVAHLVQIFREVRRVLRPDGVFFLNISDSYNGSGGSGGDYNPGGRREGQPRYPGRKVSGLKPKDLIGVPSMLISALQADGWYRRAEIVWVKPNSMPEAVFDRPSRMYELIFMLTKSPKYYYDWYSHLEPAKWERWGKQTTHKRNPGKMNWVPDRPKEELQRTEKLGRDVWIIPTEPFRGAHYAVFPKKLVEKMVVLSPEKVCPHCGAPWERIIERVKREEKERHPYPSSMARIHTAPLGFSGGTPSKSYIHRGWRPTCNCPDNDGSGKAIILDPFAGACTTLLVASRMGRIGVGIELGQAYCDLGVRRLNGEFDGGKYRYEANHPASESVSALGYEIQSGP